MNKRYKKQKKMYKRPKNCYLMNLKQIETKSLILLLGFYYL